MEPRVIFGLWAATLILNWSRCSCDFFWNSLKVWQSDKTSVGLRLVCIKSGTLAASNKLAGVTIDLECVYHMCFGYFVCVGRQDALCSVKKGCCYWAFVLWRVVRVELEKSLNTLLKQIKGQTSIHDPDVQQLNDKIYYALRSTDATPATFVLSKDT